MEMSVYEQNLAYRQRFLALSRPVMQPLPSARLATPANNRQASFRLKPTGLLTGVLVTVRVALTNTSASVATLANFGISNLASRLRLRDLSNNDRIDLRGRELHALNSARQEWLFGAAYNTNVNTGFGVNKPIFSAPATIAAGATANIVMQYYLPVAYSNTDLTGAILKNFADQTVEMTVELIDRPFGSVVPAENPNVGDAVYTLPSVGAANTAGIGYAGDAVIDVLEYYHDGRDEAFNYLPPIDLGMSYELKTTTLGGVVANAEVPLNFTSQRQTLSSYVVFDNGGVFGNGSEIVDFTLKEASTFERFRLNPAQIQLRERQVFMADTPFGAYYFGYRNEPINTLANGSVSLLMRANAVNANPRIFHTTEAFVANGVDLTTVPGLGSV